MCGIIGYIGTGNAYRMLVDNLELLEYRGYDSVGIALKTEEGLKTYKQVGRVKDLKVILDKENIEATCGIGHTRWATHGSVTQINAHPHSHGRVTLVHNGIIENYRNLIHKYQIENELVSTTDTEVVSVVLDHYYNGDPFEAIKKTVAELTGTFSLAIMFADRPDTIYAVRTVSPIVVAKKKNEAMLASDLMPICRFSETYFVLPEECVMELTKSDITIKDFDGNFVTPVFKEVDWEVENIGKKGHPFYMEKEMLEQHESIGNTIKDRIIDDLPFFGDIPDSFFEGVEDIVIAACGTSYHAGLVAESLLERRCRIRTRVALASEFIYSDPIIDKDTLVIGISQSGETIDTIEAIKYAKNQGAKTMGIINVRGSSLSQIVDHVAYLNAGPEIAVASTKAYTCQLSVLYLLIAKLALISGRQSEEAVKEMMKELKQVPKAITEVYSKSNDIHMVAKEMVEAKNLFMIGRGLDQFILMEGCLKLKEISYIHSEAYAAGELKHGPIALIEDGIPVVATLTQPVLLSKDLSNIKEVRARGAKVYAFVREDLRDKIEQKISCVTLPVMSDDFMVFPAIVALQMFAYYVALDKGLDVDKPRNLAKVVTVE